MYEMSNENTLDQMIAKTTKLPTQLGFITKLKAIFVYRVAQ